MSPHDRRVQPSSILLCPAQAALHRPAVRAALHPGAGGFRGSRRALPPARRAHRPPGRNRRAAAWREAFPRRSRRSECEAELRSALSRVAAVAEGDSGVAAGPAHAAGTAAPHRVLRHLAHPGRGDCRLDGRLGERRDEEIRLPQVPGEDRRRRRRLRLHARDRRPPLQARVAGNRPCGVGRNIGQRRSCAATAAILVRAQRKRSEAT